MLLKKIRASFLHGILSEPLHRVLYAGWVWLFGSFRERVLFDLVPRQSNAHGLLRMADLAKSLGVKRLTVLEFGVATGRGLLNIVEVSRKVTAETGIEFRIVGFDTGEGMPPPKDYRDHPERFDTGDYSMGDRGSLTARLPDNAEIIFGDIADNVSSFLETVEDDAPIGFVSVDVDYYSSTCSVFRVFDGKPTQYLPITYLYFDDTLGLNYTEFAGERLAIQEFNNENELRKIDHFWSLPHERAFKSRIWHDKIRLLHVFDHPLRKLGRSAWPPADPKSFTRSMATGPRIYLHD